MSSWVEFQRLDVMRRFELARIAVDRDLVAGTSAAPGAPSHGGASGQPAPPVTNTYGCCDSTPIREAAARLDAALDGVGADEGAIAMPVSQAVALARLEADLERRRAGSRPRRSR
ncbi:MAG: hypothetical protein H0V02_02720 [Nocardioidaceae bacterium]|nr:hypothetical protein [Nocardioidaceae bacterium]